MSIARERIKKLYSQAEKKLKNGNEDLCRRYVTLAHRIGERTQTTIPEKYRERTCQNCNLYLIPGENCTVRTDKARKIYTCKCSEKNKALIEEN